MAFSRKAQLVKALRNFKRRYKIYQKTGIVNTDVGRNLKLRIENMEKKIHGRS